MDGLLLLTAPGVKGFTLSLFLSPLLFLLAELFIGLDLVALTDF